MKEKMFIAITAVALLLLTAVAVHKTDKWYYERRQAAQAAALKREAELEAQAREKAYEAAVAKYNTCVATQTAYDKQVATVKAKTVRPVCVAPTK